MSCSQSFIKMQQLSFLSDITNIYIDAAAVKPYSDGTKQCLSFNSYQSTAVISCTYLTNISVFIKRGGSVYFIDRRLLCFITSRHHI